jgi:hypothetical protein
MRRHTQMAADCYSLFLQANRLDHSPASPNNYMQLICIGPTLVEGGKLAEYDRFCEEVAVRGEKATDPASIAGLLKTTLLTPANEALLARLRPQAKKLATILTTPNHPKDPGVYQDAFAALSLAMMAYRSGDFSGTLEWCAKGRAYPDKNEARSAAFDALAAMAAQRLGLTKRAWVEFAMAHVDLAGPFESAVEYPRGKGNGWWADWVIARILEREAEGLLSRTNKS